MKELPPQPSSYGAVYVPPHHRLSSPEQVPNTGNSLYVSASDDGVSDKGWDREHEASSQPVFFSSPKLAYQSASLNDNTAEWKQKLTMLLNDKSKQELISREKKDRRDFEQIAALASRMGLYSHLYAKVVVFSKVPLPNYRYDLDDRRPLREVNLPITTLRRVDAYLEEYLTQKSRMKESFSDLSFARSRSSSSIDTDEGLFEQSEPLASGKAVVEKILWQRSLQMRDQQQAWQESLEGRRMLEFRSSLPAYKEKEAILSAISRNQSLRKRNSLLRLGILKRRKNSKQKISTTTKNHPIIHIHWTDCLSMAVPGFLGFVRLEFHGGSTAWRLREDRDSVTYVGRLTVSLRNEFEGEPVMTTTVFLHLELPLSLRRYWGGMFTAPSEISVVSTARSRFRRESRHPGYLSSDDLPESDPSEN